VFDPTSGKRVIRTDKFCYDKMASLFVVAAQFPDNFGVEFEGRILGLNFPITNESFVNTDFTSDPAEIEQGVVTLVPSLALEQMINEVARDCQNVACELTTSVNVSEINFDACRIVTYGAASWPVPEQDTPADNNSVEVMVERYDGWDTVNPCGYNLNNTETIVGYYQPNDNPICFIPLNQADAYCDKTDDSAPLLCMTKDNVDEIFMGFTRPVDGSACDGGIGGWLVHPYVSLGP